jgi:hypothetical protein
VAVEEQPWGMVLVHLSHQEAAVSGGGVDKAVRALLEQLLD